VGRTVGGSRGCRGGSTGAGSREQLFEYFTRQHDGLRLLVGGRRALFERVLYARVGRVTVREKREKTRRRRVRERCCVDRIVAVVLDLVVESRVERKGIDDGRTLGWIAEDLRSGRHPGKRRVRGGLEVRICVVATCCRSSQTLLHG
jgi:hypothetical protein